VIPRRFLVAAAVGCGVVAGVVFYLATARADVVVVSRDIDVPRVLSADDVETRSVSLDIIPDDAARRVEDAIGLVPRTPLLRGQIVLTRGLGEEVADLRGVAPLSAGARAIALPITAVNAVGGAITPGARVDVLAVPVLGRAPAGRGTELLASAVTVLDVRGESGGALVVNAPKVAGAAPDRIASVVIAIDVVDEVRFADRIATSTFVLALASSR